MKTSVHQNAGEIRKFDLALRASGELGDFSIIGVTELKTRAYFLAVDPENFSPFYLLGQSGPKVRLCFQSNESANKI